MAFPEGLTLVEVTCQFDELPDGGAYGSVRIAYDGPLTGAEDNSIVPFVDESAALSAAGTCTIEVPATNDPGWVPQDFTYAVTVRVGGAVRRGTLQLDYQTAAVNLADLIQWDGAAEAGVTYATLAQLNAAQAAAVALVDDLSGVTNAATARDNLGLGDAATLDVGTAAGTVAAGDDARIDGALQTAGGTMTGDLVVDGAELRVDGAAGTFRQIQWSTADSVRWSAHTNNTAEGGANAGSDWRLVRYDDTGEALDAPIGVGRSTGAVTLGTKNGLTGIPFAGRRTSAGPPTAGAWTAGDVVQAVDGFWQCTASGTPGTWLLVAAAEGADRVSALGEFALRRDDATSYLPLQDGRIFLTHFTALTTETILSVDTRTGDQGATSAEAAWIGFLRWTGTQYALDSVSVDDPTRWTAANTTYNTLIFQTDDAHFGAADLTRPGFNKVAGNDYVAFLLWNGSGDPPEICANRIDPDAALLTPRKAVYIDLSAPPSSSLEAAWVAGTERRFQVHMKR